MAKRTQKPTPSPARAQGNKFDKIVKENIEPLLPVILNKIIRLEADCELKNSPKLKLQVTIEKEPDFLKLIRRKGRRKWKILHVEFEAKDERKTDARMAFYNTLIYLVLGYEAEQHVIFLLDGKPKRFAGGIWHENHTLTYKIHCISDFSYLAFIESDVPEEVLFAVLANPEGKSGEEIIRLILHRLTELRSNSSDMMKFVEQLKILSMLRKLRDETIKQVSEMNFVIPTELIEADGLFIKGKQQGMETGRTEKDIVAIRNMLAKKFDLQTIADILEVSQDYVLDIKAQLEKEPVIVARLESGDEILSIVRDLKVSDLLVEVLKKEYGI